jgi:hypothetical protein
VRDIATLHGASISLTMRATPLAPGLKVQVSFRRRTRVKSRYARLAAQTQTKAPMITKEDMVGLFADMKRTPRGI